MQKSATLSYILCIGIAIFSGSLVACNKSRSNSAKEGGQVQLQELRVAYIEFSSSLPLFVCLERGFFNKAGLKIETVKARTSNEALNALIAGKVDVSVGNALTTVLAVLSRVDEAARLFLPAIENQHHSVSRFLALKDKGIDGFDDLRGRKIGTYEGSSQLLWLRLLLRKVGIDPDADVQIIQVPNHLQVSAFKAGTFDALLTVEPYATQAARSVASIDLARTPRVTHIMDPFPAAVNVVSSAALNKHPQEIAAFVAGMKDAILWIRDNEIEAKSFLSRHTPISAEDARAGGLYWWWLPDEASVKTLQDMADMLAREGLVSRKVSIQSVMLRTD